MESGANQARAHCDCDEKGTPLHSLLAGQCRADSTNRARMDTRAFPFCVPVAGIASVVAKQVAFAPLGRLAVVVGVVVGVVVNDIMVVVIAFAVAFSVSFACTNVAPGHYITLFPRLTTCGHVMVSCMLRKAAVIVEMAVVPFK